MYEVVFLLTILEIFYVSYEVFFLTSLREKGFNND